MSKMKRMLEDIFERGQEIVDVLEQAQDRRPAFYQLVIETPSMKTVKSLLRGITTDETLILLVTGYLGTLIKS